jgi:hypothetical protein
MARIRAMVSTKPYYKHVIEPYFAIDTHRPDAADLEQVLKSKKKICINYYFFVLRSIN